MFRSPFAIAASLAMLVSACSGGSLPVKQVYEARQCPQTERGLYLAGNSADLLEMLTPRLHPTRIHLSGTKPEKNVVPDVDVDFDREQAVLVALGPMPSPGYGVSLTAAEAPLMDDILQLPVAFSKPDPDAFYPQVMTNPCIVVSLPKGDYKKIVAGDMVASTSVE